jgi:hypothetical protein
VIEIEDEEITEEVPVFNRISTGNRAKEDFNSLL